VRRFCTYLKLLLVVVVLLLLLSVIQQPFANPSITDPFIPSPVEIPPKFQSQSKDLHCNTNWKPSLQQEFEEPSCLLAFCNKNLKQIL
jgi:hypothetical protein